MQDFIQTFLSWTEGVPSPGLFRLWTAISGLAGAMERRVVINTPGGTLYPNLFLLLVANPGIGKTQILNKMDEIFGEVPELAIAPISVTKAGLLDCIAGNGRAFPYGNGDILQYHALTVMSPEFGTFCPAYDLEFLSVLNELFDCRRNFREERRDKTRCVDITGPFLNIIAGTQPGFLASLLPEEAWSMGFMSRNIMIYASEGPQIDFFDFTAIPQRVEEKKYLIEFFKKLSKLKLDATFSAEYMESFRAWQGKNYEPAPTHSKLRHYNARRNINFVKLSLISAISRSLTARIEMEDFSRAWEWLYGAEEVMGDVFRDMALKSDSQIISDLHLFLWKFWIKEKKPQHESRVYNFLKSQAIANRVPFILDLAVKSRTLEMSEVAGQKYFTPRPINEHGME